MTNLSNRSHDRLVEASLDDDDISDEPCPIDAQGQPMSDPESAWEIKRLAWTTPKSGPRRARAARAGGQRDPVFAERLKELERMLRIGTTSARVEVDDAGADADALNGGTERGLDLGATVNVGSRNGEATRDGTCTAAAEEEEPDGGMVIRQRAGDELKRVSEGILLAFKQSRPLKEPLPLSLVTSLLYRSWELDGTIPSDHPSLQPRISGQAIRPAPVLATLAQTSGPTTPAASTTSGADVTVPGFSNLEDKDRIPPPDPVKLEQMGAVPTQSAGGVKMEVNMLRGSRWRVEKEVLSGSDVI